jgi:predicted ArsR family transcriptional regulator
MFSPLLHHPIRSRLVALLANSDEVSFRELKDSLELTDGNLASHLKALEKGEYIEIRKFFEGRRPKTMYCLSTQGRQAFLDYLDSLDLFIQAYIPKNNS